MKNLFYLAFIILIAISCDEDFGYTDNSLAFESDSSSSNVSNEQTENTEEYNEIIENPFISTKKEATSTFSVDADGGSYSNVRRFLNDGQNPPANAVRTEELINYFNYDYDEPTGSDPISLEGEVSACPWNTSHRLMRVGIKGKGIERQNFPTSNLVFLVDISGSMQADNKLPLLKEGMLLLVDQMRDEDKMAIVTYASDPGIALEATAGSDKSKIRKAIYKLASGGSTNGEGGIKKAYEIAESNFIEGGNNRIILASDGDFNVGISSQEELVKLIEKEREKGIFLTTIGLGTGNYKDGRMEQLANNGNGTYEYIDDIEQAEKVFINEYNKLITVAKDVKVQVEFNPAHVSEYRLIGYENRVLANEDFDDDTKDAGEIGADQSITAIYELVVVNNSFKSINAFSVDFRYKLPDEEISQLINLAVNDDGNTFDQASEDHQFAAAVASFGLSLRDSEYKGDTSYDKIKEWAERSNIYDPFDYKADFIKLIDKAK